TEAAKISRIRAWNSEVPKTEIIAEVLVRKKRKRRKKTAVTEKSGGEVHGSAVTECTVDRAAFVGNVWPVMPLELLVAPIIVVRLWLEPEGLVGSDHEPGVRNRGERQHMAGRQSDPIRRRETCAKRNRLSESRVRNARHRVRYAGAQWCVLKISAGDELAFTREDDLRGYIIAVEHHAAEIGDDARPNGLVTDGETVQTIRPGRLDAGEAGDEIRDGHDMEVIDMQVLSGATCAPS